jgi:hypothetical protein
MNMMMMIMMMMIEVGASDTQNESKTGDGHVPFSGVSSFHNISAALSERKEISAEVSFQRGCGAASRGEMSTALRDNILIKNGHFDP